MDRIKKLKAGKMKVNIYNNRVEMGKHAARDVAKKINKLLKERSEINMVFAAAPSQNEFLEYLADDKNIDWGRINAFHLDEYIGLEDTAPQGFGNFLKASLFDKVQPKNVYLLNGNAENIEEECKRYGNLIRKNSIDIACIGIGENGHIAFNDPHVASFADDNLVKIVELDDKCRQQQVNDGCFSSIDKVPTQALTLTIPAIMSSSSIYCVVPSKTKAQALLNTVEGEIREKNPASIMKMHPNTILYAEKESANMIAS